MDEEKQAKEPAVAYAAVPTLDLSSLTVIQQDGRPVAVVVPYDEYRRMLDEQRRLREDWGKRFDRLLADIHSQMPDLPPEEVEADITAAFEEMKASPARPTWRVN